MLRQAAMPQLLPLPFPLARKALGAARQDQWLAENIVFHRSVLSVVLAAVTLPSVAAAQTSAPIPRATFLTVMDGEFKKMDADKNGQVTRAEIEGFQRASAVAESAKRNRAMFQQLDRDKNGQISPAEFAAVTPPAQINGQPLIAQYDANKDGKVSQVEFRALKLARFDRIDADKDGIASVAEQRAAGLIKQ